MPIQTQQNASLRDHFLVSMPSLRDPLFCRSVTYICEHSAEGAMGIVINQALKLQMQDIFSQLSIENPLPHIAEQYVLAGGPVSTERGFVLHPNEGKWQSSLEVTPDICLTASKDIISTMASGEGPANAQFALGYAGWNAGQLEQELSDNSWLSLPADINILFDTPVDERWEAVSRHLGIDMDLISSVAGHA